MTALTEISEHALVQYLARIKKMDVEGIRNEIRAEVAPAIAAGAHTYRSKTCTYIIREGKVVTILDNAMKRGPQRRKQHVSVDGPRPRSTEWPAEMKKMLEEAGV